MFRITKYVLALFLLVVIGFGTSPEILPMNPKALTDPRAKEPVSDFVGAKEVPTPAPGIDQPPFGTQVQTWTLSMGGTYQGAGITWRQDSGRFYLMAQGKRVYSFKPESVTTTYRQEKWNFQTVSGTYDIPWGLSWDPDSGCFWISHIATMYTDARLWRYVWDPVADSWEWGGQPRDTWQIGTSSNAWSGGQCKNVRDGYFWTVYVPTNPIMKLDPYTKTIVGSASNGQTNNRGTTFIPFDSNYVLTCSWFSPYLTKRDTTGTILQQITTYYGYADCEFWWPEFPGQDDTAYIFIIYSDASNTLQKISTGMLWSQLYIPVANDAGCRQILSPTGSLDSANTYNPTAVIRNFGTTNVSDFWTRFWIFRESDSSIIYRDSIFTSRLVPQEQDTITFASITWNYPRGNYFVKCSTMVIGDGYERNDAKELLLPVYIHDVGVMGIVNPPIIANFGDWIQPQAWVKNYGTVPESFWLRFYIDPAYHESSYVMNLPVSPPESTQRLISFSAWQAGPPGVRTVRCTTELPTDAIAANNRQMRTCNVIVSDDVGITAILAPTDTMYRGSFNPQIRLVNFGINSQSPSCIFHGYDSLSVEVYTDTQSTTLAAGATVDLTFGRTWDIDSGNYSCFVERYTPPDQWPGNDTMSKSFFVKPTFIDFQAVQILNPVGTKQKGNIPVQARVQNNSFITVTSFDVMFQIFDSVGTTELYNDTATASGVAPGATQDLTFDVWPCTIVGVYNGFVKTLPPDADPTNDTMSNTFEVREQAGNPGEWVHMTDITLGDKTAYKGGCIAFFPDSGFIYALKGNNRPTFAHYSIMTNTWTQDPDMPFSSDGKKKKPKAGAAMLYTELSPSNKGLYMTKGANRNEWWRYGLPGDSTPGWRQLADVPTGAKRCKGGTILANLMLGADSTFILLVRGSKTSDAYLYNPVTNAWSGAVPGVPLFDKKTAGVGIDDSTVLAVCYERGSKTNPVFLANLKTNTWTKKTELPLIASTGRKKKVKEGVAAAYDGAKAYMFKGGNTKEFFDYIINDSLNEREPIPITSKKGIKAGGSLVSAFGNVWALAGTKTNEFWRYTPHPIPAKIVPRPITLEGAMGKKLATGDYKILITPNPAINVTAINYSLPAAGPVTMKLYNVTGALVKSHTISNPTKEGVFLVKELPAGVYILRFNSGDIRVTRKLVLER